MPIYQGSTELKFPGLSKIYLGNDTIWSSAPDTGTGLPFDRNPSLDITTSSANSYPLGIWGNNTVLYVTDLLDRRVYGYNLPSAAVNAALNFNIEDTPNAIWSDGTTIWTAEAFPASVKAYNFTTKARESSNDFNLIVSNAHPFGLWSDGTTMWVCDRNDGRLYAYDMTTKNHVGSRDINLMNGRRTGERYSPHGIWSDGTTMWVSDHGSVPVTGTSPRILAYNLATKRADTSKEFRTLRPAIENPRGIWSDGTTMYVASADFRNQRKLTAYNMP